MDPEENFLLQLRGQLGLFAQATWATDDWVRSYYTTGDGGLLYTGYGVEGVYNVSRQWVVLASALRAGVRAKPVAPSRPPAAGNFRRRGKPRLGVAGAEAGEAGAIARVHHEPGAMHGIGVGVGDRVQQPADRRDDGRRAEGLAVHLVEPAGLVAGRHQEHVRRGLDPVREHFVIADTDCDPVRFGSRLVLELPFQFRIARTQHRRGPHFRYPYIMAAGNNLAITAALYEATGEEAARFGLLGYEVSNYAVPGRESRLRRPPATTRPFTSPTPRWRSWPASWRGPLRRSRGPP